MELEKLFKDFDEKKKLETVASVISISSDLNRELLILDIEDETGDVIDGFIRFWNRYDEQNNIPVEKREPIKIYIDSSGGNVYACLTAVDAINLSKTPVYTINVGCALSAGFLIYISGHKRFSYPNSSFMFHEGSITSHGRATAAEFKNYSSYYEREILKKLEKIILKKTKITEEEYDRLRDKDNWLSAEEAVEKGIVDKIMDSLADLD